MSPALQSKFEGLKTRLRELDHVVVAFSGGIDSSLVAYVASRELGKTALAVTSASRSLKRSDLALTKQLAASWGMRHRVIATGELSNADYRSNPIDRCFHCKSSLYQALAVIAADEHDSVMLNGTNVDDLGDHRPGLKAAERYGVRSPLVDAGFSKAEIRQLARHLGLENAAKPAAACLSSRVPYGTSISETLLGQVEAAEEALAQLGFSQFRVRHHDHVARLELMPDELGRAIELRELIHERLSACGYRFVALDLRGFRSGALNEGVVTPSSGTS